MECNFGAGSTNQERISYTMWPRVASKFKETYLQDSREPTKKNSRSCGMFIEQGEDIAL